MPNTIKYSATTELNSLNVRNWWIGTGEVSKGPTTSTGFWNMIDPPTGGWAIYVNKASQGPSITVASNSSELISRTNSISGNSYTTIDECFDYFATQNDKLLWGGEVSTVITNGLQSYVDFSSTACFPRTGNKFYNLTNSGVGYFQSATFSTADGGKVSTTGGNDGTSNYVGSRININTTADNLDRFGKDNDWSIAFWVYYTGNGTRIFSTGSAGSGTSDSCIWQFWLDQTTFYWWNAGGGGANNITVGITSIPTNAWSYITIAYKYDESGNNVVRIYRNGSQIGSGTRSTATHDARDRRGQTNLQYTLGGGYYSSCRTRNSAGEFGLFQVYNRTLSADEATLNYNLTKSRFGL